MAKRQFALINKVVAVGAHTHVIADVTDFTDNSTDWDAAFAFGDHALAGYAVLTAVQEFTAANTFSADNVVLDLNGFSSASIDFSGTNGPAGIRWRNDIDPAAQLDLVFRTSPSVLRMERVSDTATMIEFDGTDLSVDFAGAIVATSYGGVTEANLLDKSAAEAVSGAWTFTDQPTLQRAVPRLWWDETDAAADNQLWSLQANSAVYQLLAFNDAKIVSTVAFSVNRSGSTVTGVNFPTAVTATSYGGITEANLLDKSAAETITGAWGFSTSLGVTGGNPSDPGLQFKDETNTGFYRGVAGRMSLTVLGVPTWFSTNSLHSFLKPVEITPAAQALTLKAGDISTTFAGDQIHLKFNGGDLYGHGIGTRHNAAADVNNAIEFYLWDFGVDATTATGTFRALSLDQTGSELFTPLTITGALTATSYGGITEANLLDKTAAETITARYDFTNAGTAIVLANGSGVYGETVAGSAKRFCVVDAGDNMVFGNNDIISTFYNTNFQHIWQVNTVETLRMAGSEILTPNRVVISAGAAGGVENSSLTIVSANTQFTLDNTVAAADAGAWNWITGTSTLKLRALDDAYSSSTDFLTFTRSGITPTSLDVNAALTATSYGGITETNLVDKTATETITQPWNFSGSAQPTITFTGASGPIGPAWEPSSLANTNHLQLVYRTGGSHLRLERVSDIAPLVTFEPDDLSSSFGGPITATSYGGITEGDLLDKTATETVSGDWTHSGDLKANVIYLAERANGDTDITDSGQVYVKSSTPEELWFVSDDGVEHHVAGGSLAETFGVIKGSDETVFSSTTQQDDNELAIDVTIGVTYAVIMILKLIQGAGTDADFDFRFTQPAGSSGAYSFNIIAAGGTSYGMIKGETGWTPIQFNVPNGPAQSVLTLMGSFTAGADGTLQLQWAQNSAQLTNTTVQAGSTLLLVSG